MAALLPGQPLFGWGQRFQPGQLLHSGRQSHRFRDPGRANALASFFQLSKALRMGEFVQYMERTRLFYRAQGFERDYVWAHFNESPFYKLTKSLDQCRVTIVTTAVTHANIPKAIRTAESIPFENAPKDFFTSELAWAKETTHTDDRQSFFPMEVLGELVSMDRIGSIANRYHFVPTQYSHRATIAEDAPAIRRACLKEEVDIAILIPL